MKNELRSLSAVDVQGHQFGGFCIVLLYTTGSYTSWDSVSCQALRQVQQLKAAPITNRAHAYLAECRGVGFSACFMMQSSFPVRS